MSSSTMTIRRASRRHNDTTRFRECGRGPRTAGHYATCGSGITACTLALALAAIGAEQVAVYDGSWSDWGSRADAPVESGSPA